MSNETHTTSGVAAGHEETAKAGIEILDAGGNAYDAVIAGFLAACVVEPVLASLGGGGFLMAHTPDGQSRIFDFFTQTPGKRASQDDVDFHAIVADFGTAQQEFHIGLGAVATPGAIAGVYAVHEKLGRLPMSEIVKPAVRLAKSGVIINEFQAYLLTVVEPIYIETENARAQYCKAGPDDGEAHIKSAGDMMRFPEFAGFLETLAIEGADLFYLGEIASQIDQLAGCTITKSDLTRYRVIEREPVTSSLNNHDISINPPPAIGGVMITLALSMLNEMLDDTAPFGSAAYAQTLVAVMAACNEAREKSSIDTDPMKGADMLRQVVMHPPSYRGTTHISVADDEGNVAAMTVSNGEGCGTIIPGTGIMLNNMLGEEDLNATGFFNWPLDTRMSSMMSPGVIVSPKGDVTGFGSGGSNRIRSAITQFIANLAFFEMDLVAAVDVPRLHLEGAKLDIEPGFTEDVLHALREQHAGLNVWPASNMFFGGVHAIQRRADGLVFGAADLRRGGVFIPL